MPAGVTEAKAALRKRIKALPRPEWAPLLERFLTLPQVEEAKTILLFYGVGNEPDTTGLILELYRRGKIVALPRVLPGCQMEARIVNSTEGLHVSGYGIPEPGEEHPVVAREGIDLILVPNLCCDEQGYRLGHGGGYYDRYLAGYQGCTVALCPRERMQKKLPHDEYDLPVKLVLF